MPTENKINLDIDKRQENAKSLIEKFNLDNYTTKELSDLSYAIVSIISERNHAEEDEALQCLKNNYEGKYFHFNNNTFYFIKEIISKYLFSGWRIKIVNKNDISFFQGEMRDGLFTEKLSMKGFSLEDAPIKDAVELTQLQMNKILQTLFEQIQEDYIWSSE